MDTMAKVDIRKLQLLNDRIAQTIEALNQVRLSVHGVGLGAFGAGQVPGLSHTSPFGFIGPQPWQQLQPIGAVPGGSAKSSGTANSPSAPTPEPPKGPTAQKAGPSR